MKLTKKIIAVILSLTTAVGVSFAAVPQAQAAEITTVSATATKRIVSLNSTVMTLGVGETAALKVNLLKSKDKVTKWETSNSSVATVKDGVITARRTGRAVIRVRTAKGGIASCTVSVKAAPSRVSLNSSSVVVGKGESLGFKAILPANTASSAIVFSVDNPRIATCDSKTGVITGRKRGSTILRVKTFNGKTASCKIRVTGEPTSVSLNSSNLCLGAGESFALDVRLPSLTASHSMIFRSSNTKVLSCDQRGRITALSPGTATVSVRLYNGLKASCTVTVKKAPQTLKLSAKNLRLAPATKCTVYCLLDSSSAAYSKTFASSDTKVATVDQNGTVVAVAPGKAVITATLFNGVSAKCTVTVANPEPPKPQTPPEVTAKNYLDLEDDLAVLDMGETFRITPAYSTDEALSYSTADKSVATVSASGIIKAVGVGTTDITVYSGSGKASKVAVIVTGDRYSTTFPIASETDELLNKEKPGAPMKTNCQELDALVDSIMAKIIKPGMTNAQKVRACYEYLAKNSTYGGPIGTPYLNNYYKYNSDLFIVCDGYSILKNHYGTCENFSCALTILLRRLGYQADVVEGLTGMRNGGKGGHFWTDVTLGDKHYSFDAQIENNNLGYDGEVLYYWYGTKPEHNFKTCEYQYLHRVHDFAVID